MGSSCAPHGGQAPVPQEQKRRAIQGPAAVVRSHEHEGPAQAPPEGEQGDAAPAHLGWRTVTGT